MKAHHLAFTFTLPFITGCGKLTPSAISQAPANAPLIGKEVLAGEDRSSNYSVMVPICNRGPETLKAKVTVHGDKADLFEGISEFSVGGGSWCYITLFDIKPKRNKPIYAKLDWEHGQERGTKSFMITPKQTNRVEQKRYHRPQ